MRPELVPERPEVLLELVTAPHDDGEDLTTRADALIRMAEAEDTLRAISGGEIDAFVVPDGGSGRRVFTLATADRPYRMFVENMRDGAATLSPAGLILYANRRLAELLSCGRESIVGTPLARFLDDADAARWAAAGGRDGQGLALELDLIDADGALVPVLVGASPLDVDGDQLVCLTFTDLSAQRAQDQEIARLSRAQADRMIDLQVAQAALTKQATHDALTGLPNRALVVDRIEQALAYSNRTGSVTAVYYVDLDRFKQINDTKGHAAGDGVLRRVAEQLVAAVRPGDTVARIGGDEFVVLAPAVDSHQHAVEIGERLVAELTRGSGADEDELVVPASVGISISGVAGTAEAMLDEADTAMYQAKSLGGGRANVFDVALGLQVQQWSNAQRVLRGALDEHRVIAYYQPIIDLTDDAVAGFEALARIDEGGQVLPPSAFISVAEETGLVIPLGSEMLSLACGEAAGWNGRPRPGALSVAVNLSARQFGPGNLVDVVGDHLAGTGLAPARLHLELTETAIIDLHPDILEQLRGITEMGVEVGLDDFGTGYASLTHLRRLPLTFVKIDQSFVAGLETDREDERIVAAVIDLAANLGLRSIAEGVETPGQLERLRELGCDQAQGYLFARPLPPTEIVTGSQPHPA